MTGVGAGNGDGDGGGWDQCLSAKKKPRCTGAPAGDGGEGGGAHIWAQVLPHLHARTLYSSKKRKTHAHTRGGVYDRNQRTMHTEKRGKKASIGERTTAVGGGFGRRGQLSPPLLGLLLQALFLSDTRGSDSDRDTTPQQDAAATDSQSERRGKRMVSKSEVGEEEYMLI